MCMCLYVCECACGSSLGRAEKAFSAYLQTAAWFMCSRTLQTVAAPGAAGVAERSHTASKKQDTTAGQSI